MTQQLKINKRKASRAKGERADELIVSASYLHRRAALALVLVFACVGVFWAFYPDSTTRLQTVEGIPSEFKSCGKTCDTGIRIGEITLACAADPLGPSYACGQWYQPGVPAKATYFRMRTVMSLLGGWDGVAVVVRLEQNGQPVPGYGSDNLASSYFINSLLLIVVFVFLFLAFIKLDFFKRRV